MAIKRKYAYHKPSTSGLVKINLLREAFSNLHDLITNAAPESRERAIALTELEACAMWAIKAVVTNDPESEVAT